jgi:cytochrome c oxidase subunit 4
MIGGSTTHTPSQWLLALTVFGAYQPLGPFNTALALAIALCKALLVLAIFMELRERSGLTLAFAGAGFFWLAIMLWLAFADFSTRPSFTLNFPA